MLTGGPELEAWALVTTGFSAAVTEPLGGLALPHASFDAARPWRIRP